MNDWLRKLRGLAGLTVFGGVAGLAFGVLMMIVTVVFFGIGGLSPATLVSGSIPWAIVGALSAGGVGLALAALESHRSLSQLSASRAGLYGLLLGGAAVVGMLTLLTPGLPLDMLALGAGFGGLLGGGVGSGLLLAAKRADRAELPAGSDRDSLPG